MKFATLCSALIASASAFAPSQQATRSTQLHETKADLEVLAKKANPLLGFYDPLNLAEAEFWGASNEATIGFLRHSEIKHGRVAMFAFVGYIVHANGIKFPWAMQMDGSPFPSETNPPALWDAIPDVAKWQIFVTIAFLEFWSELSTDDNQHYMAGGKPGKMPSLQLFRDNVHFALDLYDPAGLSKNASAEKKEAGLVKELNNGRLAMLGLFGFLCEQTIPGSVPALSGIVQPYSGEVMAPFSDINVAGVAFGL